MSAAGPRHSILKKSFSAPNISETESHVAFINAMSSVNVDSTFAETESMDLPFEMKWIHGYNQKVNVINLNDNLRTLIFYAASNCGVLYDWKLNRMDILRGHPSDVVFIKTDTDGKWLLTGDAGEDSVITIWQLSDLKPKRSIFNAHKSSKILKVSLSEKYLLTLAGDNNGHTTVAWWIWSFGNETPHDTITINEAPNNIETLMFNPIYDEIYFLLSKSNLWVGELKVEVIEEFNKTTTEFHISAIPIPVSSEVDLGKYVSMTYINISAQAMVATSKGYMLVFGCSVSYSTAVDTSNVSCYQFIKALRLETEKINCVTACDNVIVTGNGKGELRFYDPQLKILYWCQDFKINPIIGMSFNFSSKHFCLHDCRHSIRICDQCIKRDRVPLDATVKENVFEFKDLVVTTENEGIGLIDVMHCSYKAILAHRSSQATSICTHPEKSIICIGYEDGIVELFNHVLHVITNKIDLRDNFKVVDKDTNEFTLNIKPVFIPNISVSRILYSPTGVFLACGLNNGNILMMNPLTLEIKQLLKETKQPINHICFTVDSELMAISDENYTVIAFRYNCQLNKWSFVAKYKPHYKEIVSLFFVNQVNVNRDYKLFSFSKDRCMVEYDIGMSLKGTLNIYSIDRIEESAIPIAVIEWPSSKFVKSGVPAALMSVNENKFRLISYNNGMILGTFLSPLIHHPIHVMILTIDKKIFDEHHMPLEYLLFAAHNIIGINKLPLDGNPFKHVQMIASADRIIDMKYKEKAKLVYTISKNNSTVSEWQINHRLVEEKYEKGGTKLNPYFHILSQESDLFTELKDLFFYIQILCKGTFSSVERKVGDMIPINSLADIFRSLGYYPSQFEIENITTQARYKIFNKEPAEEISFEDFVILFINNKPAYEDCHIKLTHAFKTFAHRWDDSVFITKDRFTDLLLNYGELFTPALVHYLLGILIGDQDLTINDEPSPETSVSKEEDMYPYLPKKLTLADFLTKIMKMTDVKSSFTMLCSPFDSSLPGDSASSSSANY